MTKTVLFLFSESHSFILIKLMICNIYNAYIYSCVIYFYILLCKFPYVLFFCGFLPIYLHVMFFAGYVHAGYISYYFSYYLVYCTINSGSECYMNPCTESALTLCGAISIVGRSSFSMGLII